MSTNLFLKVSGVSVNLYQTPSYISELILSNHDGGELAVKKRYLTWVKYLRQQSFNTTRDKDLRDDLDKDYAQHLAYIESLKGKLEFYLM